MRDHTRIEELLTLETLSGLDDVERDELRAALAEHGSGCAECAALRTELTETAGLLPFALDPVQVSPELETAVFERARATGADGEERHRRWSRTLMVATVVVVALVLGVAVGSNLDGNGGNSSELAALVAQPGARLVHLQGDAGTVAMAISADSTRAYVTGNDLQPLPDGKVYELWSISGTTPTSLTCLEVVDGSVRGPVTGDMGRADLVAITVEDASCPSAPTTEPILTAPVS
jgi:Anti-sigma-K factor rskA